MLCSEPHAAQQMQLATLMTIELLLRSAGQRRAAQRRAGQRSAAQRSAAIEI